MAASGAVAVTCPPAPVGLQVSLAFEISVSWAQLHYRALSRLAGRPSLPSPPPAHLQAPEVLCALHDAVAAPCRSQQRSPACCSGCLAAVAAAAAERWRRHGPHGSSCWTS